MQLHPLILGLHLGTKDKTALNLVPAVVPSSRLGEGLWGPWCLLSISAPFVGDPRARRQLSEEMLGEGAPLGRLMSPHGQQDSWAPATGATSELRVGDEHPGTPSALKGQDPEMGRKRELWQMPRASLESAASRDKVQGNKRVAWWTVLQAAPEGPWRHGAGGCEQPCLGARHAKDLRGALSEEPLQEGVHLWAPETPGTCPCGGGACAHDPLQAGALADAASIGGYYPEDPRLWARPRAVRPDVMGSFVSSSVLCSQGKAEGARDAVCSRGRHVAGPTTQLPWGTESWAGDPHSGVSPSSCRPHWG